MSEREDAIVVTGPGNGPSDEQKDVSKAKAQKVATFLALARTRFQTVQNAESQLRLNMLDDWRFRAGEQWDASTLASRQEDDRACLTINRIPQFIRQVTNAQRASNLAVKVTPVDSGADVKTAEVLQGLVRHIEQQSDAAVAYSTAGDHQATMGRGYWYIDTEYEDEHSFVQSIRIKRIRNPFTVFMDPASVEADGSDARYCLIVEDIPKDEYEHRFPDSQTGSASLEDFSAIGASFSDWMPEGKVKIATYWYVEEVKSNLNLCKITMPRMPTLPGEMPVPPSQAPDVALLDEELKLIPADLKYTIARKRTVMVRKVKQALINATEVLEGNEDLTGGRDWPGKWIPVVPAIGDEIDINGVIDLRGMVRDAKDPQRLYNYQNSTLAETLALVPRAPYIGYEGQFEGHEVKWNQANRRAYPYLEVRPFTIGNQPAPFPQRVSAGADVGAIMTAIQQSDQDLKATMGLYEPSLGIRQSNSQSGVAIQALQKQGENANSNFLDNMSRAIRFTGRILIDLIPHIYDAPRIVRIIGPDEREQKVMIHAGQNIPADTELPEGVKGVYDVGVGRYDVVVNAGPSLDSKRQEAFVALSGFVQSYPQAFPIIADLLMSSLDWPGAQAAAERFAKLVPPEVQDEEDGAKPEQDPQMVAQMQQMMQQLEQKGVELDQVKQVLQSKQLETEAKVTLGREQMATDMKIAQLRAEVELTKEGEKARLQSQLLHAKAENDRLELKLQHQHELGMHLQERQDNREDGVQERTHAVQDMALSHVREDHQNRAEREDATAERQANAKPDAVLPPVDPSE